MSTSILTPSKDPSELSADASPLSVVSVLLLSSVFASVCFPESEEPHAQRVPIMLAASNTAKTFLFM